MSPPLQTAAVVTAELISMTALVSMSVKEGAAAAESLLRSVGGFPVKPKSSMRRKITGASLVPVIVT